MRVLGECINPVKRQDFKDERQFVEEVRKLLKSLARTYVNWVTTKSLEILFYTIFEIEHLKDLNISDNTLSKRR